MEESENDERRDNVNEAIHDRGGGDEPEEDVQTARPNATCDPDDAINAGDYVQRVVKRLDSEVKTCDDLRDKLKAGGEREQVLKTKLAIQENQISQLTNRQESSMDSLANLVAIIKRTAADHEHLEPFKTDPGVLQRKHDVPRVLADATPLQQKPTPKPLSSKLRRRIEEYNARSTNRFEPYVSPFTATSRLKSSLCTPQLAGNSHLEFGSAASHKELLLSGHDSGESDDEDDSLPHARSDDVPNRSKFVQQDHLGYAEWFTTVDMAQIEQTSWQVGDHLDLEHFAADNTCNQFATEKTGSFTIFTGDGVKYAASKVIKCREEIEVLSLQIRGAIIGIHFKYLADSFLLFVLELTDAAPKVLYVGKTSGCRNIAWKLCESGVLLWFRSTLEAWTRGPAGEGLRRVWTSADSRYADVRVLVERKAFAVSCDGLVLFLRTAGAVGPSKLYAFCTNSNTLFTTKDDGFIAAGYVIQMHENAFVVSSKTEFAMFEYATSDDDLLKVEKIGSVPRDHRVDALTLRDLRGGHLVGIGSKRNVLYILLKNSTVWKRIAQKQQVFGFLELSGEEEEKVVVFYFDGATEVITVNEA